MYQMQEATLNSSLYESVETINGKKVTHLKSSIFYWGSLLSMIVGIYLISKEIMFGGFLIITLCPVLVLYPGVRYFIGGKDSVGGVIATAVVEEVLKHKIENALTNKSKRRRRS